MKKFSIQVGLLIMIILAALYATFNPQVMGNLTFLPTPAKTQQIKIDDTAINADVADTPAARQAGLSGRQSLDPNSGMLFVFQDPKIYQFWMKGMHFSLDFIFIRSGKVVDILSNVPFPADPNATDLPVYAPTIPIDMMLEVNAGFANAHNIKIGDTVYRTQ